MFKFRSTFKRIRTIHSTLRKFTLAIICSEVWRANFLNNEFKIGVTPPSYIYRHQSIAGKSYLEFINVNLVRGKIITTRNRCFYVDSYDESTNTVYKFEGCWIHKRSKFSPEWAKTCNYDERGILLKMLGSR